MEGEECGEVDGSLKVIGGREGLGGEGVMAGMADEPLDGTEGFGVVRAEAGEPGRGIGSGDLESASSVRAEKNDALAPPENSSSLSLVIKPFARFTVSTTLKH